MQADAYRLWQHWQQMHYPRRGLPADEAARARLVTLDGIAGPALEQYFRRRTRANALDPAMFGALTRCRHDLDPGALSADASRYFGRLLLLIDHVLAQAGPVESGRPDFQSEPPMTAPEST